MSKPETSSVHSQVDLFIDEVKQSIVAHIDRRKLLDQQAGMLQSLMGGKMLRTRFAARLFAASLAGSRRQALTNACMATELVHTATLVHDDIIDGALIRRSQPAVWATSGTNYAVLMGDLLYCEAIALLLDEDNTRYAGLFVQKVQEICKAEIEQELVHRKRQLDATTYLQTLRSKTGPLFAFLGHVCGRDDLALSSALEEAGYLTGTAYQIADDLLDVIGNEERAGKTLGTDTSRGKFTLAREYFGKTAQIVPFIKTTVKSAVSAIKKWPDHRDALRDFFVADLQPVFDRNLISINIRAEIDT
jgi:heptaprenyl diphosphate synthase